MNIKDSHVTIMVNDMDKSISFYQSIGFELKNRWGDNYAMIAAPGISLGIHPKSDLVKAEGSGIISIGFTPDNFEAAQEQLNALSIPSEPRDEEGGQFIHFKDPDGTELYFYKSKW